MLTNTMVQVFFFRAMLTGYVTDAPKGNISELPSYKSLEFKEGDWRLVDLYCTSKYSNKSAGTTTIWYQGEAVWWMSYNGYYEEVALPILKAALTQAYTESIFFGGRGLASFNDGQYSYINRSTGDFHSFSGEEFIVGKPGVGGNREKLGFHKYSGMSLLAD